MIAQALQRMLLAIALAGPLVSSVSASAASKPDEVDGAIARLNVGAPNTTPLSEPTALEKYIALDDGAFKWELVKSTRVERPIAGSWHAIRMTSQTWRTKEEVNIPEWTHWVCVWVPDTLVSNKPILFIGGGRRQNEAPSAPPRELQLLARAGTIAVTIDNVPNQPLRLGNDPADRNEDALVARSWVNAIETGDPTWIARFPMVKAAVKAMDTLEQFLHKHPQQQASYQGNALTADFELGQFLVAGRSKRGWVTWLVGAVDKRVGALVPIVIDVLDLPAQMRHHHAAYGFWAPALNDYVETGFTGRFLGSGETIDPALAGVLAHDDPVHWQSRVGARPKYVINATGDEFFLPDSSQFYEDRLSQPWRLRYVPNNGHSLKDSTAPEDLIAFYRAWASGADFPQMSWAAEPDTKSGQTSVTVTSSRAPASVRLWTASAASARDFRITETGKVWTSSEVPPLETDALRHRALLQRPSKGFVAYFIECQYAMPGGLPPLTFTTRVFVLPDTLPHAQK